MASRPPRIALIGNMNNNAFSQMRYFRDLGADAVVFPFASDAEGASSHFAPEADTYRWESWREYVRTLPVPNSNQAIVGAPHRLSLPPRLGEVARILRGFDRVLGTGIAPALFERLGERLDGFGPYSVGIEFFGTPDFSRIAAQRSLRGMLYRKVRALQARGIRRTRHCFNADMGLTRESFEKLGVEFEPLPMPMVYNGECYPPDGLTGRAREAVQRMQTSDLALFSAARQFWIRPDGLTERGWQCANKNSDWLLRGLAQFIANHPSAKPVLVMVEYGPDIEHSRRLAVELGIADFVFWLPIIPRREILSLLRHADIGVGEFMVADGLLWGGTGFEVLAAGRPLLQSLNFTSADFLARFGYMPPLVLDAKSAEQIADRLAEIFTNRQRAEQLGTANAKWFDEYAGIGLARRWLDTLIGAWGGPAR